MKCNNCDNTDQLTGAVLSGKFGNYCRSCIDLSNRLKSPLTAQYDRDRDREAHQRDLLQPWDKDGNPNTEFIRQYPDSAVDYFSEDELREYG